eukprot:SAG31_NODE_5956_length_2242_cov_1.588894_2_plen_258_part_00
MQQLTGHTGAVWGVLELPDGVIATASADKTIRLWRGAECIRTLAGHSDAVRALQAVPGIGFLSAANDGTCRLWSMTGEELAVYPCHEQYIYGLAVLSPSEFATCSEDRTVKIFRNGQLSQTINHPGVVWSVCALPNGDLATGKSFCHAPLSLASPRFTVPRRQPNPFALLPCLVMSCISSIVADTPSALAPPHLATKTFPSAPSPATSIRREHPLALLAKAKWVGHQHQSWLAHQRLVKLDRRRKSLKLGSCVLLLE